MVKRSWITQKNKWSKNSDQRVFNKELERKAINKKKIAEKNEIIFKEYKRKNRAEKKA